MERVGEADGFVLDRFPTGVKSSDVVADIAGKEAMLAALDFVFKPGAVVGGRWFFVSRALRDNRCNEKCGDSFYHLMILPLVFF
jgi:hypothetical protein